ncbi:MAG TPA: FeoA family protein [Myxococcota bacterium]
MNAWRTTTIRIAGSHCVFALHALSLKVRITLNMTTLDQLRAGDTATIARALRLDATVLRLVEMGMTVGAQIVVTRRAPLGDPLEISVRNTRLCLRREHAAIFEVEKR